MFAVFHRRAHVSCACTLENTCVSLRTLRRVHTDFAGYGHTVSERIQSTFNRIELSVGIFDITKKAFFFISGAATMRFASNAVWLTAVVVTIGRGAALPSQKQFGEIVDHMLGEDGFYGNVLSERVRLNGADIPAVYRTIVPDPDNVDPTRALLELPVTGAGYSGKAVDLSALIVGTSVTCLLYKRFAVQLALARRMVAVETDPEVHLARAKVLAHLLPLGVDLLTITRTGHVPLMELYDKVAAVAYQSGEQFVKDEYAARLGDGLNALADTVRSSCVGSSAKHYYEKFDFTAEALLLLDPADDQFITDQFEISDKLDAPALAALMMENENAILDEHERLSVFRNMEMAVWKVLLGVPALPSDPKEFERKSRPGSRGSRGVVKMLEKSNPYMANVVFDGREIPIY